MGELCSALVSPTAPECANASGSRSSAVVPEALGAARICSAWSFSISSKRSASASTLAAAIVLVESCERRSATSQQRTFGRAVPSTKRRSSARAVSVCSSVTEIKPRRGQHVRHASPAERAFELGAARVGSAECRPEREAFHDLREPDIGVTAKHQCWIESSGSWRSGLYRPRLRLISRTMSLRTRRHLLRMWSNALLSG